MEKINNSNFDFLRENLRKHYEKLDQETVVKEKCPKCDDKQWIVDPSDELGHQNVYPCPICNKKPNRKDAELNYGN